jgi:signal transduction histidine kinase
VGVLADLEVAIERAGASVEAGPLPELEADPMQMRQLFQNLIGNALKFAAPDTPPRIRISAERAEAPPEAGAVPAGEWWRLSFEDNGIGFDEKYLDRIFNVFQRLHGRGVYEGTGIGLAVCRKIVERHGGSITARSRPGDGATFVVTLPIRQREGPGSTDTRPQADAGVLAAP